MHDPMTVAHEVKYPWRRKGSDYRETFITVWHVDPCKGPGGDDTCGWFMRAHHGDPEVLARIQKRFEFDWDRTFTSEEGKGQTYLCGLFCPNGEPHLSIQAIVLNLFQHAAWEFFNDGKNSDRAWKKSKQFIQRHLSEILLFAENPVDSLHDSITLKWGNSASRDERMHNMAVCIYGWILRAERPWYKHPRWHFWHWKIQCNPLLHFKRWAFSRCCKCGKGFAWGYSPVSNNWNSTGPLWFRSQRDVYHSDCNRPDSACIAQVEKPS